MHHFDTNSNINCFLLSPKCLDSLIKIADQLHEFRPHSERTPELQRKLLELEVEFLPSNVIYVPVNSSVHRVWRIVASESIAISTKERVPCIVCLEVVDINNKQPKSLKKMTS